MKAPRGEHASILGRLAPGNINIHTRPRVKNPDGSYSTVRSISIGGERGEPAYLIPTVVGRKVVSDDAARRHFMRTGQHLGKFQTYQQADRYGARLHREQAREYGTAKKVSAYMKAKKRG